MNHPSRPSLAELDTLNGEILPERIALSAVTTGSPVSGGGGGGPAPAPAGYVMPDGHSAVAFYACQTTHTGGTGGLIGLVGLGDPPSTTVSCLPASVVSR